MITADPWAGEAAKLPLAFSQVREDPRLDTSLARLLPEQATVVMIASGGDTLVELARLPLQRIHAVDLNPAQLALARLKCFLAGTESGEESACLLGHAPMDPGLRGQRMGAMLDRLQLDQGTLGPIPLMAELGVDHVGRYERCFAELRRELPPWTTTYPGAGLETALAKVMSQANLVALFGEGATQNPLLPFHEHFAKRTRLALARAGAEVNPFLLQMYAGTFAAGHRYDWLENTAPLRAERVWHCGLMVDVLNGMESASVDMVHLSNILDWLSPIQAAETLESTSRVLKPGGRVIVRQLNSSLELGGLTSTILWNSGLGRAMEKRDRSFFYSNIFTGLRA